MPFFTREGIKNSDLTTGILAREEFRPGIHGGKCKLLILSELGGEETREANGVSVQ